jgi:ATP-dependent DNA helicase RecQ
LITKPLDILKEYWNYSSFRSPQEEIILSVIEGNNTLALLPTGAGKSICFQVPAIYLGGTTLVVTPLIALMNDQVQQLQQRNINAVAIHSGLPKHDQQDLIEKAKNLPYCILYISPEKLNSIWFKENLVRLHVRLVAIDEAHCVSQWGYDFRPQYLQIRESLCEVNATFLALTASATPEVYKDIIKQLSLDKVKVFQTSTYRENLIYEVRLTDDKENVLIKLLKRQNNAAIVYVRSRLLCHSLAKLVEEQGIKSQIYHAGLTRKQRELAQEEWIKGEVNLIFATNAFGMGIDKANVRQVYHYGAPPSLEAYYQEAGRAGRDTKYAWVYLISSPNDHEISLQQILRSYPEEIAIQKVFQALCNKYQLAEAYWDDRSRKIDFDELKAKTNLDFSTVHYALKMLQLSKIINYQEDHFTPSKVLVLLGASALFELYETNAKAELIIKSLIRLYGAAIYEEELIINESNLGKITQLSQSDLVQTLK